MSSTEVSKLNIETALKVCSRLEGRIKRKPGGKVLILYSTPEELALKRFREKNKVQKRELTNE